MAGGAQRAVRIEFNKMVDDLETLRAALSSGGVVAVTELIADHATNKTFMDEVKVDYTALRADVTAIRAEVVKLVTDMATRISENNTLATKLNADAGVTDTNYAAAAAATAVAPAALTSTTIATDPAPTLTATAPSGTTVDTAADLLAAKVSDQDGVTT